MARFLTSLMCALLLLTAGCQTSSPLASHPEYGKIQDEVSHVIESLRNSNGVDVVSNLNRLHAYAEFAVPQLCELAEDPNPQMRGNAMWVLAKITDRNYPEVQEQINDVLWDGLDDRDHLVRYEAATGLLARNQWDSIPVILEGMQDQNPQVRMSCHDVLRTMTSRDYGYVASASEEERMVAMALWSDWYEDWQSQ